MREVGRHLPSRSPSPETNRFNEFRLDYPTILTTARVAEKMHSTIGDVRDKVLVAAMTRYKSGDTPPAAERPKRKVDGGQTSA